MKENCLDIGTIQAFLDRELEQAASARVSSHIASCGACAITLSKAEDESAVVFSALEREFDALVPTQRLWSKINDAIDTERREAPFWQKISAFVRTSLADPSLAVAASLMIAFGIFAAIWMNRTTDVVDAPVDIARTTAPAVAQPAVNRPPVDLPSDDPQSSERRPASPHIERASYRPEPRRAIAEPVAATTTATAPASEYMPGEDSYVTTIANLSKAVDDKKDVVLRPSQRVAYERDMAVVNDSITKMRQEVKRNPNDQSARRVLYRSYQNKIDLLNSVSQKEELMASLR